MSAISEVRQGVGVGVGWFKWRRMNVEDETWVDSRNMGIWCAKMPPVTKPEEKSQFIEIPGRGSFITVSEGEWAYKSYLKEVTIIVPLYKYETNGGMQGESTTSSETGGGGSGGSSGGLSGEVSGEGEIGGTSGESGSGTSSSESSGTETSNTVGDINFIGFPDLCVIHEWLRGEGHVQFSTEPGYRYHCYIAGKIEFNKLGEDMVQAKVPFWCSPYRMSLTSTRFQYEPEDGAEEIDTTIDVQGNVPTRPTMYLKRLGSGRSTGKDITVTLRWTHPDTGKLYEQSMKFYNMKSASVHVLCNPQICTNDDEDALWEDKVDGAYFWLYPGTNQIICEDNVQIIFHVNWRWV